LSRPNQPTYQGIALDRWAEMFHNPYGKEPASWIPNHQRCAYARDAIKHIGTNGVPWLLDRLGRTRPTWSEKAVYRLSYWLFKAPRKIVPYQCYAAVERYATALEDRARDRSLQACEAFAALNVDATPFIPLLLRIAHDSTSRYRAWDATLALGYIGTNAIPALLELLTTKGHPSREAAAEVFAQFPEITENAMVAVPALVQCLDDPNTTTAYFAACALRNIPADPSAVVPALTRALRRPESDIRAASAEALAHFGQGAQAALPALLDALTETNSEVRHDAANAIEKIAPSETLWLAASNTIHSPDPELRVWAVRGLAMSGCGKSSQVPMLLESLADPDSWVSTVASNWLGQIAPQAHTNAAAQ
jgi:HEAT repeat protein